MDFSKVILSIFSINWNTKHASLFVNKLMVMVKSFLVLFVAAYIFYLNSLIENRSTNWHSYQKPLQQIEDQK